MLREGKSRVLAGLGKVGAGGVFCLQQSDRGWESGHKQSIKVEGRTADDSSEGKADGRWPA